MLKLAAALMVGLFAGAGAVAADLPNGNASPGLMRGEPAYNWSGIYAGASVGLAWDEITAENAVKAFGSSKAQGFIGSLQAGFNKQAGALVIGLEVDVSLSNAHGDKSRTGAGSYGAYTLAGSGNLEGKLANLGTVRARFGYAMDNVMAYATVGYAFGRHQLAMSGNMTATTAGVTSTAAQAGTTSNTMSGLVFGGGIEYAFARGVSAKLEYLRIQFVSSSFFGDSWASTPTKANVTLVRTGVNFRI